MCFAVHQADKAAIRVGGNGVQADDAHAQNRTFFFMSMCLCNHLNVAAHIRQVAVASGQIYGLLWVTRVVDIHIF